VIEKLATLQELDHHWTLDDIYRANALLDMRADTQAKAQEKARKK
jgi:ABC-type uncharacterized transport system substrate-binding protein